MSAPQPTDFERALMFSLQWEGGYVNHPLDPGGATNLGITQATYNAWRKSKKLAVQPVLLISRSEAVTIYHERYWIPAVGRDEQMQWPLSAVVFDSAVNCGVGRAKQWLSRAQNWGREDNDPLNLARDVIDLRVNYYISLATNPFTAWRFKPFLRGWLNRCRALKRFVGY